MIPKAMLVDYQYCKNKLKYSSLGVHRARFILALDYIDTLLRSAGSMNYYTPFSSLLSLLRPATNRCCHIIGNGISCLSTIKLIPDNAFVITMNSGVILPIRQDLICTEAWRNDLVYSEHVRLMSQLSLAANHAYQSNDSVIIIEKNFWRGNISPARIKALFPSDMNVLFLHDLLLKSYPVEPGNTNFKFKLLDIIINSPYPMLVQCLSSAVACLLLAVKAGFSDIYVHGCDGGGPSFYHSTSFVPSSTLAHSFYETLISPTLPHQPRSIAHTDVSREALFLIAQIVRERHISITIL